MEGKSGLLIIMVILSVLFLVVGIVFGVMFGIKNTALVSVDTSLVLCVVSIGLFVLSSLGVIVARNSVITADNTYDMLCRIDAILKEKGLTDADLARRDLKKGEKIAKREAELKAKLEAKAMKEIAQENKKAELEASKKEAIESALGEDEAVSATTTATETVSTEATETIAPEQPVVVDAPTEPAISYEEWKTALNGKVTCGECAGTYSVNKTKNGKVVLVCQTARKEPDKCSQKSPISVSRFVTEYLAFYKEFFGEELGEFNLDIFDKTVQSVEVKDGKILFKMKTE